MGSSSNLNVILDVIRAAFMYYSNILDEDASESSDECVSISDL